MGTDATSIAVYAIANVAECCALRRFFIHVLGQFDPQIQLVLRAHLTSDHPRDEGIRLDTTHSGGIGQRLMTRHIFIDLHVNEESLHPRV